MNGSSPSGDWLARDLGSVNRIASARLRFIAPFFTNRALTAPIRGNGGGGRLHGVAASEELVEREKSGLDAAHSHSPTGTPRPRDAVPAWPLSTSALASDSAADSARPSARPDQGLLRPAPLCRAPASARTPEFLSAVLDLARLSAAVAITAP